MKGSMLDMYRRPDKLVKACDVILERRIANAFPADSTAKDYPPRVGLPLWRGDPVFMSDAQFKKFYWPGLKKSLQTHVDLGYVPVPFFEAAFGDRLECLLELPKGKNIGFHRSRRCGPGQGDTGRTHQPAGPLSEYLQAMVDYTAGIIH